MAKFTVTETTTLSDLDKWMELRPNIETAKIRRPKGDPIRPSRGYRVIFKITDESLVMGEPANSLVEAANSAITHIEDLFPL